MPRSPQRRRVLVGTAVPASRKVLTSAPQKLSRPDNGTLCHPPITILQNLTTSYDTSPSGPFVHSTKWQLAFDERSLQERRDWRFKPWFPRGRKGPQRFHSPSWLVHSPQKVLCLGRVACCLLSWYCVGLASCLFSAKQSWIQEIKERKWLVKTRKHNQPLPLPPTMP